MHLRTTHTQLFSDSLDFVQDNPGEPVPEETFTYSHLSPPRDNNTDLTCSINE